MLRGNHLALRLLVALILVLTTLIPANVAVGAAAPEASPFVAWGDNVFGQASVPEGAQGFVAAVGGRWHSVALRSDGTVYAWGLNSVGQASVPAGLASVKEVAAGRDLSVAVKQDGTVVAWGANEWRQRNVPDDLANVKSVATGGQHVLALKGDGTVVAWGHNSSGQCTVPADLTGVVAIAAGANHSLALKGDGTVVAWGSNYFGQTDLPPGLTNAKAISAKDNRSLALKADGTVVAWGDDTYNYDPPYVPYGLDQVIAIAAGGNHNLALKSDHTVVAWNDDGPLSVPASLGRITGIAAGSNHSLAWIGGDTTAPTVGISSPAPYAAVRVGFPISYGATDEEGGSGLAGIEALLANGTTTAAVSSGYMVTKPGLYTLTVTATDKAGNSATLARQFVAYDPSAGFVTGEGVLPAGAVANLGGNGLPGADYAGGAQFSLSAKYKSGNGAVPGLLSLQFGNGALSLTANSLDWLVVEGDAARFQGKATIQGQSGEFPCRVEVRDRGANKQRDQFKLEVWAVGANPFVAQPIYQASGDLASGNIKTH